ncbi:MAG: C4-dicarboxylate ABC transporter [Candidatus Rokubacteria bacterium RBG_16_73_20]|nr:MAG: C4-dicarboxylate ABC transporter [Candidatus Rokubacteria bacterium GWA2_73_35]OGK91372.1 MAG: C4-dicarboxylate ABC transporter [Candidatus Rokubacteria bacterium RBG_16_73_20]HBH04804.1 C4-dicarboxylate ABC transporter [Candidatus Rokubacteria bacterium]
MSPELLGLVLLFALIGCIFIGFPIAFTLIILALVFGYIGFGDIVFNLMVFQTLGMMKEETLAAVPLFIFMGHILEQAGLMERLFKSFQFILAPVRGSLYLGVLLTATIFATATGIIGASVTVMGLMAAPVMIKAGYDPKLSAGAIAAGGTLGILIPPSVMLVVLGPVLGVSVIQLFAAAIVPGVLLSGLYIGYAMLRSFLNPGLGPPLPMEERATSYTQIVVEFVAGIVPLGAIIFAALGSIIFGLATPTEAAAMGAFGATVLTACYRRLTLRVLRETCFKTLQTSSMVLFLAVASNVYGSVFTRLGTGTMIANAMLAAPVPPLVMMALLMGVIFLLGWPLEWPAIILIFVPIFLPVVIALKFNLVWFGTLLAVNLQTAFLSPPVAMAAYYLKAVAPQWELRDIYRGMFDFMILQVIGLAAVFFFPDVALWLPRVLFGD